MSFVMGLGHVFVYRLNLYWFIILYCFRVFVLLLVGLSILWIPLIKSSQGAQLFIYIQAVTGYIAPPLCVVFLFGVLIPRVNEEVGVNSIPLYTNSSNEKLD